MATELFNPIKEEERELKSSIGFFVSHLELKELKILKSLALELANNYSKSYKEWKNSIDS
jgi:hypothetical protein